MVGRLETPPWWQQVGPGPTLTTCTDQKPHEEVESHLCPLLLRKGVGVAKGSLVCK